MNGLVNYENCITLVKENRETTYVHQKEKERKKEHGAYPKLILTAS